MVSIERPVEFQAVAWRISRPRLAALPGTSPGEPAGMSDPVGLVTGSAPFAGLPTNPAELVLPFVDGAVFSGIRVTTAVMPVSYARLRRLIPALVETPPAPLRPIDRPRPRRAGHQDRDDGAQRRPFRRPRRRRRPAGRRPAHRAGGPDARAATWKAGAVVDAILAEGVPASLSFHAGTHLCNLTLFTFLGAISAAAHGRAGRVPSPPLSARAGGLADRPPAARRAARPARLHRAAEHGFGDAGQGGAGGGRRARPARQRRRRRRRPRNTKETARHVARDAQGLRRGTQDRCLGHPGHRFRPVPVRRPRTAAPGWPPRSAAPARRSASSISPITACRRS